MSNDVRWKVRWAVADPTSLIAASDQLRDEREYMRGEGGGSRKREVSVRSRSYSVRPSHSQLQ